MEKYVKTLVAVLIAVLGLSLAACSSDDDGDDDIDNIGNTIDIRLLTTAWESVDEEFVMVFDTDYTGYYYETDGSSYKDFFTWQVSGKKLRIKYIDDDETMVMQIVKLTRKQLVLRNEEGDQMTFVTDSPVVVPDDDDEVEEDSDGDVKTETAELELKEKRILTLTGNVAKSKNVSEAGFELCDNSSFKDPIRISCGQVSGIYQSKVFGILDDFKYYYRSFVVKNGKTKYGKTKSVETPQLTYNIGNKTYKMIKVEGGPLGDFSIMQTEYPDVYNPGFEICGTTIKHGNQYGFDRYATRGVLLNLLSELSEMTGLLFRYPTLEEWQYAAKGGKLSKDYLYSGSNDVSEVAWYNGNCQSGRKEALLKGNELGIYDMSGNYGEIVVKSSEYDDFVEALNVTTLTDFTAKFFNIMWNEKYLKVCGGNWSSNESDCQVNKFKAASDFNLGIDRYQFDMDKVTFRLVYNRNYKSIKIIE